MGLTTLVPTINLLSILRINTYIAIVISVASSLLFIFFGDRIQNFINKYKFNKYILIISILFMVLASLSITKNIFDFSAFFNSASERADMTINYFNVSNAPVIRLIYVFVYFICFIIALILYKEDKIIQYILVIFIVFLNPLCCSYFYKIDYVYHRTYDAIFNPFIYIYLLNLVAKKIENRRVYIAIFSSISILCILNTDFINPTYYNSIFEIDSQYNKLYKTDDEKLDVIEQLRNDIKNNAVVKPKIVTHDVLTQSMIPDGIYTYGRGYGINPKWSNAEYQIYAIFFKEYGYDNLFQPKDADTKNVNKYINEAGIDYLVLEKDWSYKDSETNEWKPLMYKIDELKYPFYENDKYVIYHFDRCK